MNFEKCIEEFNKYTSNFDMNIKKVNRKYYHTYRVVGYMERLAKSEGLSNSDLYLAKVCALLHDIARFKQAVEFKTFNDYKSFDHGNKACEILTNNDYISNFLDSDEDKNVCLKAIKNHNKFAMDSGLSEREIYFTKLLRDSDKLDIMDTQRNSIEDGESELFSPLIDAFKSEKLYKLSPTSKIPNMASDILFQLCFIFDFNFKESYKILNEKQIIERKIKLLKEFCDEKIVNEIENIAINYIKSKI